VRVWPPILWLGIFIGSLFILRGTSGDWRPGVAIAGVVLVLATFGLALYLALGREHGPRHPGFYWAMTGMAVWYLAMAAAASLAGPEYAVAGLLAGVIPLTALALLIATARMKTVEEDGDLKDATVEANDDPLPGIGLDDATPAGETSELHDLDREDPPVRRFQRRARGRAGSRK
jgi:hypothetical protein